MLLDLIIIKLRYQRKMNYSKPWHDINIAQNILHLDPSTQGNDLLQLKLKESLKVVNKFCEYLHYRTYALYTIYIYIYTYTYTYIYIYMYIYIYIYIHIEIDR